MFNTRLESGTLLEQGFWPVTETTAAVGNEVLCRAPAEELESVMSFQFLISFFNVFQTEHFQRTLAFGFLFY